MVGQFNLISVAFAALFLGLGVDFGIQFAVRYRAERYDQEHLRSAIVAAGRGVGWSLTLAAVSLLAGFFSFLPTEFRGVSELGLIAGVGHDHRLRREPDPPSRSADGAAPAGRAGVGRNGLARRRRPLDRRAPGFRPDRDGGRRAGRRAVPAQALLRRQPDEPAQPARSSRWRRSSISPAIRRSPPTPST